MASTSLSDEDVKRLLADRSPVTRAETAAKIARDFDRGKITSEQRRIAEDIFRLLVKDAEVRVREALAHNLKDSPTLPHDVAAALARDVDSVALPMLASSQVLTDDDLVEIVRLQGGTQKQAAIAGRATVSERVAGELVEAGDEVSVATLLANTGAHVSDASLGRAVDRFGTDEKVQTAIVGRPKLPMAVAERLVYMVSESLKDQLVRRHELPAALTTDLILQSRERATIGLSADADAADVEKLVNQLHENGRLTPSIVMRSLCMGDLGFFEAAMARLAGVPLANARRLIYDEGQLGLKALYEKAKMPPAQYIAMRAATAVARETDYDGGDRDRDRHARRMIERILTQYGDLGVDLESDDLEYLLHKLAQLPAAPLDGAA